MIKTVKYRARLKENLVLPNNKIFELKGDRDVTIVSAEVHPVHGVMYRVAGYSEKFNSNAFEYIKTGGKKL